MSEIYEVGTIDEEIFSWADFIRSLERRLEKEIGLLTDQVLKGKVEDFARYQHSIGIIRGLELARKHIRELRNT